jgi:hypothetical protein
MATGVSVTSSDDLHVAAQEVLAWLREGGRFPGLLQNQTDSVSHYPEIAEKFLRYSALAEFSLEIVCLQDAPPVFEGRWTHKGADFVGFRQPPPASTREDAAILACAALLRNDWCRSKLPMN